MSSARIRVFYDRVGRWLDSQSFYEDPAIDDLLTNADFENARSVFELGCGTGRLAEKILASNDSLFYTGVDLSPVMISLAGNRLNVFGDRADVKVSDGAQSIALPDDSIDRFVATYVFDLMAAEEIALMLEEAHRVLKRNGKLCLVSLTNGVDRFSRIVTAAWRRVREINPMLVGGCRPLELLNFINQDNWRICHLARVARFGITSEVVIAEILTGH